MRVRTGIMVTVTEDRCNEEFVRRLNDAGAGSVRINSAHTDEESLRKIIRAIRQYAPEMRILMDTKGPEIRTTALKDGYDAIKLGKGDRVSICFGSECFIKENKEVQIGLNVDPGQLGIKAGDKISIDDGAMELTVTGTDAKETACIVERGGTLGSRKTVSIPSANTNALPAVSERDKMNILTAVEEKIDMIAHSFVRTREDVESVKKLIEGSGIEVYAKIECRDALSHLEEIADASDGILIARGDLGSQVDFTLIPAIQHQISKICRKKRKPMILATQMMQTMIENPLPTRAEIQDITTAVWEGINTLLLTGETAQGRYPTECVEIMRRTIENAEKYLNSGRYD